jgi:two-component system phosphate regulon sensor histidine kinase PhoR
VEKAYEEARHAVESSVEKQQGKLEISPENSAVLVACDMVATRQVLVNLIENALKYSGPQPKVEVSCALDGHAAEISVLDHGPGIPEEDLKRVFERFYRVDKARARGKEGGGSGLGLAIVKHLVENSGGQVGVENLLKGGCRFWFRLPLAQA